MCTNAFICTLFHCVTSSYIFPPFFFSPFVIENDQRKKHTVFPPEEDIFSALNLCPLSKTKVVIVGQDPYHGPGQGMGLCFSVRKNVKTPPSLRNIYKELINDSLISNFNHLPNHGNLERWARQGVLMINNVLTVRKGEPKNCILNIQTNNIKRIDYSTVCLLILTRAKYL